MNRRFHRGPVRGQRGNTILGFMIGLILGLTVAVVVALFVTRAPVPFVNKAARAPDRVANAGNAAEPPDPNKPLYSKSRPLPGAAPAPEPEADDEPREKAGILERLFGRRADERDEPRDDRPADAPAPKREPAARAEPPSPRGEVASVDPRAGEPRAPARIVESRPTEPAERSAYLLQAGAFRAQEDADAMRARLALVGFEARVVSAEVNGQTMYRVRVGPFPELDDMNKARARLAENGIEASVVRQR